MGDIVNCGNNRLITSLTPGQKSLIIFELAQHWNTSAPYRDFIESATFGGIKTLLLEIEIRIMNLVLRKKEDKYNAGIKFDTI